MNKRTIGQNSNTRQTDLVVDSIRKQTGRPIGRTTWRTTSLRCLTPEHVRSDDGDQGWGKSSERERENRWERGPTGGTANHWFSAVSRAKRPPSIEWSAVQLRECTGREVNELPLHLSQSIMQHHQPHNHKSERRRKTKPPDDSLFHLQIQLHSQTVSCCCCCCGRQTKHSGSQLRGPRTRDNASWSAAIN